MLKNTLYSAIIGLLAINASNSSADTFEVKITNITAGQVLTPPVIFTHVKGVHLFNLGEPAPDYLVPLAEGGDTSAFVDIDKSFSGFVSDVALATGPVKPGKSITLTVETTTDFPYISFAGMLATTNDAFAAINGAKLDFNASSQMLKATVYDAGSEFNSEKCEFIPGPPCGNGGVRDTDKAEGYVSVSNGVHGVGDLVPQMHTWLNPAISISITRRP